MLLGVEVSDTTIYRLTDKAGEQITQIIDAPETRDEIKLEEDELLYVECDGSMLLTREEGWKEVKVGRVFKSSSLLPQSSDRQWIRESQYVAHLGEHTKFETLMSHLLDDPYRKHEEQIVFVGDGARWQWAWVEAEYPKATQILDFYHAMEHIGKFLSTLKLKKDKVDKKMHEIGDMLKRKGVDNVIASLDKLPLRLANQKKEYENLLKYISNNKSKMDYPEYIRRGMLIGSGAIESAHRTVLQKRMKLSGQRWSKRGMSNMIKLRTASMSGHWDKVRANIRMAA